MSYITSDTSVQDGQPIELYKFTHEADVWRYNSGLSQVTYNTEVYEPEIISRKAFSQSKNLLENEQQIIIDKSNLMMASIVAHSLEYNLWVTIFRGHGSDFVTHWIGKVMSIDYSKDYYTLNCHPISRDLKREGLSRRYSVLCDYALYGEGCYVDKLLYKRTGTIEAIDGLTIEAAVFGTEADGWFTGGMIVINGKERLIIDHDATAETIKILYEIPDIAVNDSFIAYAGCDHSRATCDSKFSNLLNFGGQPFIPRVNPFSGEPIT